VGALQATKSRPRQYGVAGRFVFKYAFTAGELCAYYKVFGDGKVCKGQSAGKDKGKIKGHFDTLQDKATN